MRDSLPVSTGTIGIILLMISFLNQAFLGHQFFQVQGRNRAFAERSSSPAAMGCSGIAVRWSALLAQLRFCKAM